MGKTSTTNRDWTQIYAIYGMDQWQTLAFLFLHAALFSLMSVLLLVYFDPICSRFETLVSSPAGARFAAGFTGSVTAISAACLFYAAGNFFYSAVPLHHEMAHRMVSAVGDWSTVRIALDLGCGRGILLNTVATQLKKTGSSGRVVGLAQGKTTALSTLRTCSRSISQFHCRCARIRHVPRGRRPEAAVSRQLLRCGDLGRVCAHGGKGARGPHGGGGGREDESAGRAGKGPEAWRGWGRVGPCPRPGVRREAPGAADGGHPGVRAGDRVHDRQPHRDVQEARSARARPRGGPAGVEMLTVAICHSRVRKDGNRRGEGEEMKMTVAFFSFLLLAHSLSEERSGEAKSSQMGFTDRILSS